MKLAVLAAIVCVPSLAAARDDLTFARQVIPAATTPASSGATGALSKVIYLNRSGATIAPGDNDARTNKSTMVRAATEIPAWNTSDATWNATVACMKELFAPFDVTITTTDPGSSVQHIEAVFGGTPGLLGMEPNVAGVAPFKSDCSILENAIVFTFTDQIPNDARFACEVMAQEVAHAYGLDHELLPSDPLTYLRYDGKRSFQNMLAECGETKARACGAPGSPSCRSKQNSVALLFERLGAKAMPGDFTTPTVVITHPPDGAIVVPGFELQFVASDNTRVTMASIYVDGVPSGSSLPDGPEWTIRTPAHLARGMRTIDVEVTDGRQTKTARIRVEVQGGMEADDDLSGGCSSTRDSSPLAILLLALFSSMRAGSRRFARSR